MFRLLRRAALLAAACLILGGPGFSQSIGGIKGKIIDKDGKPVLDADGNLYFGVNTEIYSSSPDGKVRWHFNNTHPVSTSPAAVANGQIFIATPWSGSGMATTDAKFLWQFSVGYDFFTSANVSPQGVIYSACQQRLLAFLPLTNSAPPADSSWPLWRANPQHTGRVQK